MPFADEHAAQNTGGPEMRRRAEVWVAALQAAIALIKKYETGAPVAPK